MSNAVVTDLHDMLSMIQSQIFHSVIFFLAGFVVFADLFYTSGYNLTSPYP